jgi:N-methylhydantoinase B
MLNTRVSSERKGDLLAQVAACRLGHRRFGELLQSHAVDVLKAAFDELIQRTRMRLQAAIAELPEGVYSFEDFMDDDGLEARDIPIRVKATVSGGRLHLDFSGSAPQVPGNINCPATATRSAVGYAVKALLDPEVPNNQGAFDAVEWTAPSGTILNAAYPAAVANRAQTVQRIIDVILGALAKAIPDRVVAAANGANTTAVFTGIRPDNGERYIYLETLGGGFGARYSKDGKDGVQVHITNTSNLPVEVIETEYPLFVESYGFAEDTGGAGRFRGGLGLRRAIRPIGHSCTFSGSGERFSIAPWGLFGGRDGACGSFTLRRSDGQLQRLPNKPAAVEFRDDDTVILTTPGAGGYGSPAERDAAAISVDHVSGKFSAEFLAREYGDKSPSMILRSTFDPATPFPEE